MKGKSFLLLLLCCCSSEGGEHMSCNRTYEKIGCFKQNEFHEVKLFDILLMTDRDWTASQYGGQDIDWLNWADYIHGFACRCLERLKQLVYENNKKYHHFSVSNYGECWTSDDVIYDLAKIGLDDTCVGDDFFACQHEAVTECVGAAFSQYVYHIHYEDEQTINELEMLNSECRVETMTICLSPSTSQGYYVTSTVQP